MAKPRVEKPNVDKTTSVSIRQIENGFLVNESGYTGNGRNPRYFDRTWYSKTNPVKNVTTQAPNTNIRFGGKKG